ncbi:lipid kinase [Desulfitobacterium hafniense]|uniref:Lipid kinase n=1 Tax=Desulfitobacterium hafniense TaxID=49338 RepID=A0A0W1JH00_DESHA|nr:diacylglycerol kinase family protein [Desulfitobacterium hafniense]KTE90670.1 lipid kinase [Desulfitobacterium hafniense]
MNNNPWFAIVNPASANGQTRKIWPKIYKRLLDQGVNLEFAYTTGPGDATNLTRQAMHSYTQILAVGGDGTLNEVVNGFFADQKPINPEASLAVLSHGTGGDFLRTLDQKRGLPSLLEVLHRQKIVPIDCGLVQYQDATGQLYTRYFLNVADVGLGGMAVSRVNQHSKFLGGKLSFLLGGIMTILTYKNKNMKCVIDGKIVVNGPANSIWIGNGRFVGGGMMIAPHAELDDGLFDIVVLGNLSMFQLLRHLPKIYQGHHLEVPDVTVHRGKEVSIISNPSAYLELDGEHPGFTPVHFSLIPQGIRLWT